MLFLLSIDVVLFDVFLDVEKDFWTINTGYKHTIHEYNHN